MSEHGLAAVLDRKTQTARIVRRDKPSVPPVLLALGLMLEGNDAVPDYVQRSLAKSLTDADAILSGPYRLGKKDTLPQTPVQDLLCERASKSAAYGEIEAYGADAGSLTTEIVDAALWLGIAIAYRYFVGGAR